MTSNEFDQLINHISNIPPITKFFTFSSFFLTLLSSLKIVKPHQFIFILPDYINKLNHLKFYYNYGNYIKIIEVLLSWLKNSYRFISTFSLPIGCFSNQPLHALFDIYMFYTYSNGLEGHSGVFNNNYPDFFWYIVLNGTFIILMTTIYNKMFDLTYFFNHHQALLACITYTWSRYNKNTIVNLFGVFNIRAYYLPVVNLILKITLNGYSSFLDSFFGIFSGYFYQCILSKTFPILNLFNSRKFFSRFFPKLINPIVRSDKNVKQNNYRTLDTLNKSESSIDDILKAPKFVYNFFGYRYFSQNITSSLGKTDTPQSNFYAKINQKNNNLRNQNGNELNKKMFFKGKGHSLLD